LRMERRRLRQDRPRLHQPHRLQDPHPQPPLGWLDRLPLPPRLLSRDPPPLRPCDG